MHDPNFLANMSGGAGANGAMAGEEAKPFRCPVVGCEKAYKNQNGLKYHKTVRLDRARSRACLADLKT